MIAELAQVIRDGSAANGYHVFENEMNEETNQAIVVRSDGGGIVYNSLGENETSGTILVRGEDQLPDPAYNTAMDLVRELRIYNDDVIKNIIPETPRSIENSLDGRSIFQIDFTILYLLN